MFDQIVLRLWADQFHPDAQDATFTAYYGHGQSVTLGQNSDEVLFVEPNTTVTISESLVGKWKVEINEEYVDIPGTGNLSFVMPTEPSHMHFVAFPDHAEVCYLSGGIAEYGASDFVVS
jgi:hypothetical protein